MAMASDETRSALPAACLTALLHLGLVTWLDQPPVVVATSPAEVRLTRAKVDDSRLPPQLRLAETSPEGNREAPPDAPFVASRNQSAAQPEPVPGARSPLPRSEGEHPDVLRLAQATPLPPGDPVAPPPVPVAEAGTPRVAGTPPRPANPLLAPPRPSGTSGLLLRNPSDVGRAGAIALDARFSTYGDYSQRMLEAVQASWWRILDRMSVPDLSTGTVVVRFRIRPDGSVTDATIVSSTVPALAALACKDAVTLPAPFDPWRPEMAALLGGEEWVTITFHYL
jgi:hypothetical protein